MAKGKILQTIIDISGEISPTLGKTLDKVTDKLGGINLKAIGIGAAVGGIAVATGKAVFEAGKYLTDLGSAFDGATDSIRIGTGATGEALDGLLEDFDAVYASVPTSMEDASKAIADYNTRLGLSGPVLQDISKQAIQVSDMLGDDLNSVIESSSQAFQQWGIDAEDMGGSMDYIFKLSQSTGMGFSEIMDGMQKFGPQLQEMGYSFETASALMGQLDKAGVNTEEVLGAMKKSVGALAKEGISASEGLEMYYGKIMEAGSAAEAASIASEIFGTRAGSTMAAAIRDGSLAVGDLAVSLMENGESIAGAADDTYDFAERLQMMKQGLETSLKPIANTVFDGLNQFMPTLQKLMEKLVPAISDAVDAAMPFVEDFLSGAADMLDEVLPMIVDLGASLLPILLKLVTSLLPPLLDLAKTLIPPLIEIVQAILPPIASVLSAILPIVVQIAQMVLPVIVQLIHSLLPAIEPLLGVLLTLLNDLILPLLPPIMSLVESLLPLIEPILSLILSALSPVLELLEPLGEVLSVIVGWISKIVGWVAQGLTWVVDLVLGDKTGDVADGIKVNGYATGGITDGLSIAGEDPRYPNEYVISLNPAFRTQNLSYWAEAGRMLGADASDYSLGGSNVSTTIDFGGVTFAPQIEINGQADKQSVMEAIEEEYPEFIDFLEEWLAGRGKPVYA